MSSSSVVSPARPLSPPPSPPTAHKRRRTELTTEPDLPPCDCDDVKCDSSMDSHLHDHLPDHAPSIPPSPAPPMSLHKAIRTVQQQNISEEEKQTRIHKLFAEHRRRATAKPAAPQEGDLEDGRFPGKGAPAGCEHYERNCWIRAKCCGKYYPCRRCHDENEDHEIDRHATEEVGCVVCGEEGQPVAKNCRKCGVEFARYFCAICKFYDGKEGKEAYHCDKCGICRVGKGLGIDNHHCDGCGTCVPLEARDSHPCRDRSLDANCPICHHYLRTSTEPVVFMRCGHTMHVECLTKLTESRYTCPLCNKSLTDMSDWYRALDERIAKDVLPPEYARKRSRVLCHDCNEKTVVQFHFVYHKCGISECGGYNTRVLEQFDVEDDSDPPVGGAIVGRAGIAAMETTTQAIEGNSAVLGR